MQKPLFVLAFATLYGFILLAAGYSQTAELKIAVVDIDQISGQYKELLDRQQELNKWVQEKKDFLNELQDFMFLSAEEFQEMARLLQIPKAQWTEEQKKRESELRNISANNEKKYLDLQAKPNRTAEEQNQFNTLREMFLARDRDLKALSNTFDQQLKKQREEIQGKLVGNVRAAIEAVAKAKGYQLVLDKSAVYFVTAPVEDITSEVLKSLNSAGAASGAPNATPPATP